MKTQFHVIAIVALVLVNVAALGSFWYMHWNEHTGSASAPAVSADTWGKDLSESERARLARNVASFRRDVQPIIDQTRAYESDLLASLSNDPVPRAHIDSLLESISKNRLAIARRAIDKMIAMGDSIPDAERRNMMRALRRLRTDAERSGERGTD